MQPKVSILIPCYNAEQWVGQAIESALAQTYPKTEVIVVDDGSTDGSLDIIQTFGNSIRWETGPNRGGNIARNRLLELSTGDWLQYLDADDYLLVNKIEQQIQYLAQVPHTDVLYSPSIYEYCGKGQPRQEILSIPEPHDPWILLARWFLPQTGSPLWRKQAVKDVKQWRIGQSCCQEHELYLRLLIAGKKFRYYSNPGSVYRQWSELTVCKRNQSEVFRQRLKIENSLERHLQHHALLTPERQYAINQARFECARKIWPYNPHWAADIMNRIRHLDRNFIPTGQAAPTSYRIMYKLFGFSNAEQIANFKRVLGDLISPA